MCHTVYNEANNQSACLFSKWNPTNYVSGRSNVKRTQYIPVSEVLQPIYGK